MSEETTNFWSNLGTTLAKGAKATSSGTVFGSVWLAKQVTKGAKATGKAFTEEWQRQKEAK